MSKMKWKRRIPTTISDVEVASQDQDVTDISFSVMTLDLTQITTKAKT